MGASPTRIPDAGEWLTQGPRWLLLGALVAGPWLYGSTPLWAVNVIHTWLGIAVGLWFMVCLMRRGWPSVPRIAWVTAALLVAEGWFMAGNAQFEYDRSTQDFISLKPLLPWAAGSMDRSLTVKGALAATVMLGVLVMAIDLAQYPEWRKRLLLGMGLTGASIAGLGLIQKCTGAPGILWDGESMGRTFFATYRYHANAGALLNLAWPVLAGFVVVSFVKRAEGWRRVALTTALVLTLAGVAVNTSRAAGAIGLLLGVAWAGWACWQVVRGRMPGVTPAVAVVTAVVLAGFVITVAAMAGLDHSLRRWGQLGSQVNEHNPRLLATQVCLDMVPHAGWFGFGPGTFQTTFPYFTRRFGEELRGRWLFAHEDYLQTLVEWGVVGALGWGVLVFGGIIHSVRRAWRHREALSLSSRITHLAVLLAMAGVLLHALVDFPMQVTSIQLYVSVFVGLLWGSRHWLRGAHHRRHDGDHSSHREGSRRGGSREPGRDMTVSA